MAIDIVKGSRNIMIRTSIYGLMSAPTFFGKKHFLNLTTATLRYVRGQLLVGTYAVR